MIRKATCTLSAVVALGLAAAAPAVACDQPTSTASPQSQQAQPSQAEQAKFEHGFFRHHHRHHHHFQVAAQPTDGQQQPTDNQQSTDSQQQSSNCDHGGSDH